jgi:Mrp family chromosome partitioning ATPase
MALTVDDTTTGGRLLPPDPRTSGPGGYNDGAQRKPIFPEAEELFRGIYTRAGLTAPGVIAVTSAIAGEGKTTVALGLAVMVAQDFPERRVLLAEADLRQPVLATDFGVEPSPGLSDALEGVYPVG